MPAPDQIDALTLPSPGGRGYMPPGVLPLSPLLPFSLSGRAGRCLVLALALLAASCGPSREEKELEVWVPLEVRLASPSCASRSGGAAVNVWIASSRYRGEAGAQVSIGGVATPVLGVSGPVFSVYWALTVSTPPLPRGRHAVSVILPSGERDELADAFTAVPDALGLSAQALSTGLDAPGPLAAGRFSASREGIACGHEGAASKTAIVLLERSGASFAASANLDAVETVRGLASSDFDRDGIDDLAAACWEAPNPSRLRVFLSTRAFSAPQAVQAGAGVSAPIAWDPDGSGLRGLAACFPAGSSVETYGNDGTGGFAACQATVLPGSPSGLTAARFDADGLEDIAVCVPGAGSVYVLRGLPQGLLAPPGSFFAVPNPLCSAAADLDGDGDADLAVGTATPDLRLAANDGFANFSTGTTIPLTSPPGKVLLIDFDLDGNPDVLAIHGSNLVICCTDGSGGLAPGRQISRSFPGNLSDLAARDMDGDGFPDLFVSEPSADTVWFCSNTSF